MPITDTRSNGRIPINGTPTKPEGGAASAAIARARKSIAEAQGAAAPGPWQDSFSKPQKTGAASAAAAPTDRAATVGDQEAAKQRGLVRGLVERVFGKFQER